MRTYNLLIACILFLLEISQGAEAQQNPDVYVGVFMNAETGLSVTVAKNGNNYTGKLEAPNQSYAFSGTKLLGVLVGNYEYNGAATTFTLAKIGNNYFVTSDGISIEVKRQSLKPSPTQPLRQQQNTANTTTNTSSLTKATGGKYTDPFGGYFFNGPAGWQAQQQNGGYGFSKSGQKTILTISPHNYNSMSAVQNDAKDVQEPQSNTYLTAQFEPYSDTGAWVLFRGKIQNQPYIIASIALLSPHGGGVNITAVAPTNEYNTALTEVLRTISNTVVFSKPQTSPLSNQWKAKLGGKELLYLNTSNGLSDKLSIQLCTNGQFSKKDDSSYSSQNFSSDFNYAGRAGGEGRWEIIARNNAPVLVLKANDGQVFQYEITLRQASNELGLNGKRYFVRQSQQCP